MDICYCRLLTLPHNPVHSINCSTLMVWPYRALGIEVQSQWTTIFVCPQARAAWVSPHSLTHSWVWPICTRIVHKMGHHIVYHEPLRYVLHINYKCIVLSTTSHKAQECPLQWAPTLLLSSCSCTVDSFTCECETDPVNQYTTPSLTRW